MGHVENLLMDAADEIARVGWSQGSYYERSQGAEGTSDDLRYLNWQASVNGPVCAMGAFGRVTNLSGSAIPMDWDERAGCNPYDGVYHAKRREFGATSILDRAMARLHEIVRVPTGDGDPDNGIPHWNDQVAQTPEDVILGFKRAAFDG